MLDENVKAIVRTVENTTSSGLCVHGRTETPLGIDEVLEKVSYLGKTPPYVIKMIMAVFVSTFLPQKDPVWLLLVGNPSSNKTTLVDLLAQLDDVYRLDSMTANPFSSGQRASENPQDLLPLLNQKCFIVKEYGTIFGRSDEMVKQLISDLVAIYDGEYSKHSPTRGTITYKSRFSHIGCVTPMTLNSRQRYMNMVGPRFVYLRIPELTDSERRISLGAIWSDEAKLDKDEIAGLVAQYCLQLKDQAIEGCNVEFAESAKQQIENLSVFIARARGIVITECNSFQNSDGETTKHYEAVDRQIEEPFRAFKQLRKLAIALAIVNGSNVVGVDELNILKRVALSSMTTKRADIIEVFKHGDTFTAKEAGVRLSKSYKTAKRNLDELVSLGVLDSSKSPNQAARTYTLKHEFKSVLHDQWLEETKQLFADMTVPELNNITPQVHA